jgi:hypothetical protein
MSWWIRIGAAALGFGIAFYGLGKYEAWWTIAFAIGGLAVLIVPRRQPVSRVLLVGAAVAGLVSLGMLGAFFVAMSPFADARPDLPGGNGVRFLASGVAMLLGALVGLGLVVRSVRRWKSRSDPHPDSMDLPIS